MSFFMYELKCMKIPGISYAWQNKTNSSAYRTLLKPLSPWLYRNSQGTLFASTSYVWYNWNGASEQWRGKNHNIQHFNNIENLNTVTFPLFKHKQILIHQSNIQICNHTFIFSSFASFCNNKIICHWNRNFPPNRYFFPWKTIQNWLFNTLRQ